jgi:hypothetical protein
MAITAQGLVFEWGQTQLQEVQSFEISVSIQQRNVSGRNGFSFRYRGGELRLNGFSTVGLPLSDVGRWRQMRITAPVGSQVLVLWEGFASLQAATSQAAANGAVLFAFLFKLYSLTGGNAGTIQGS